MERLFFKVKFSIVFEDRFQDGIFVFQDTRRPPTTKIIEKIHHNLLEAYPHSYDSISYDLDILSVRSISKPEFNNFITKNPRRKTKTN